ncbi:MAG: hypothetical protein EAY75_05165 [Bacteroidetes bacterium]|nr:MAG: hypothetical protein EAY75_05165 [Bacteroidota bacterium]
MAFIWTVLTRGTSTPLLVDTTSNCADAAGVAVPMPTFWVNAAADNKTMATKIKDVLKADTCCIKID